MKYEIKTNGKERKMKKSGFTLIELLVVIVIISVLAGMMLPAIGKAKAISEESICKGNLKQMGYGYTMYQADFDSYFPPISKEIYNDNTPHWFIHFGDLNYCQAPYSVKNNKIIKNKSGLWCPTSEKFKGALQDGATINTNYYSYACFFSSSDTKKGIGGCSKEGYRGLLKQREVKKPVKTMVNTEQFQNAEMMPWNRLANNNWVKPKIWIHPTNYGSGGSNVLWADFHVDKFIPLWSKIAAGDSYYSNWLYDQWNLYPNK